MTFEELRKLDTNKKHYFMDGTDTVEFVGFVNIKGEAHAVTRESERVCVAYRESEVKNWKSQETTGEEK